MIQKLKLLPDYSNYNIYGLSTYMKDYVLCLYINSTLQIQLIREKEFQVVENNVRRYSLFSNKQVFEFIEIYLLSNYCETIPLLNTLKNINYFFIVCGNPLISQLKFFEENLKKIPQMLFVSKLNITQKTLLESLLMDFEIHITTSEQRTKKRGMIVDNRQ